MQSELESCKRAGFGTVTLSGIGKVNAARAATELILSGKVECIINSGCAGGLSPEVGLGDLVIAERCAWHDVWCGEPNEPGTVQGCPRYFEADRQLLELCLQLTEGENAAFTDIQGAYHEYRAWGTGLYNFLRILFY